MSMFSDIGKCVSAISTGVAKTVESASSGADVLSEYVIQQRRLQAIQYKTELAEEAKKSYDRLTELKATEKYKEAMAFFGLPED